MKLIIKNTSKAVTLNGLPARIWEGETSTGIPVHCYITRVAVHESLLKDVSVARQFESELAEQQKPSAEIEAIPLRIIL